MAAYRRRPAPRPSLLDDVDDFVDAGDVLVLHERGQPVDALVLLRVRLGAPAAVVVDAHVEEAEGDDLVLVADVARVVGALEARRLVVTRVPRAAELLERSRLQPPGSGHDDHRATSFSGWVPTLHPAGRCAQVRPRSARCSRRPP